MWFFVLKQIETEKEIHKRYEDSHKLIFVFLTPKNYLQCHKQI